MAQRNLAVRALDQERLGIDDPAVAGCRVTDMTDRGPSDQAGQHSFVKDVADVAHGPREANAAIVGDRDASALLPAVLERVQAQAGHVGRVLVAVNPKDAARIFEFVHVKMATPGARRHATTRCPPLHIPYTPCLKRVLSR